MRDEQRGALQRKSFAFAIRVVKLYQYMIEQKREFVMSKQLLRCGTSVGANVREAQNAESRSDFVHKYGVAQKEADESIYWLELLLATDYLSEKEFKSISNYSACHAQRLKSRATQPKPACAGWVRWVPVGVGRLWLCSRDFSRQAE
jgi:four helix bundle protein